MIIAVKVPYMNIFNVFYYHENYYVMALSSKQFNIYEEPTIEELLQSWYGIFLFFNFSTYRNSKKKISSIIKMSTATWDTYFYWKLLRSTESLQCNIL